MTMEKTDITLLTETKGAPPVSVGIKWFHKQRKNGKGGGVAIGIKDHIAKYAKIITPNEDPDQEIIWTSIDIPQKRKIILGCFYGPQESTQKENVIAQYEHLTSQLEVLNQKGIVILGGDFNAKLEETSDNYSQKTSRNGKCLQEMIEKTDMKKANDKSETGKWT